MSGMGTKWLAGTVLGLPLSVALCTLAILGLPGGWESCVMAAVVTCLPLWVAILCCSLLFRSSRAAWLWLAAANLLCFGLLWGLRLLQVAPSAALASLSAS